MVGGRVPPGVGVAPGASAAAYTAATAAVAAARAASDVAFGALAPEPKRCCGERHNKVCFALAVLPEGISAETVHHLK